MERVQKLYRITEETAEKIKIIAKENAIPESYALDNIIANYWRMTRKKKTDEKLMSEEEQEKFRKEVDEETRYTNTSKLIQELSEKWSRK